MYRYHALGGASLLVLGSTLSLVPSNAQAQTALPAVTVEAPRGHDRQTGGAKAGRALVRPNAGKAACRRTPAPAASLTAGITPSVARALLYQAPNGQTETTIDRSQFDNRPSFSVADVLRESPGISVKQGNGPRDFGISIRGSNARNGFGIRNLVIFDDGFPVTQPDGLSRSDLIDPKAYGAIDVIRGPSSALYGNYATGGALNFRTRRGGRSTASNTASRAGSFGYLNNYLADGKKVGNFESCRSPATRAATASSRIAGSIPRPSIFSAHCTQPPTTASPSNSSTTISTPAFRSGCRSTSTIKTPSRRAATWPAWQAADRCRCSTTASTERRVWSPPCRQALAVKIAAPSSAGDGSTIRQHDHLA